MKILVTGGAGYVGSLLVPELLALKHKVIVVDSLIHGQVVLLSSSKNKDFKFIKGDIRDNRVLTDAIKGVDLIIHLAALVSIAECLKNESVTKEINYEATVQLDKDRDRSQGVVFASTGNVYGDVGGIYTEDIPVKPLTLYGKTKINAEKRLLDNGNVIAYRFANGFGVSPSMRNDLFLNDMVFQAVNNRHIDIYHKDYRRSFIHVKDMARSLVFSVINYEHLVNGIYNIGHESMTCTKEEVVLKIKEKFDFRLDFTETQSVPDERSYEMSFKKIREKGFETVYTIDEGIDELIKAYQMLK